MSKATSNFAVIHSILPSMCEFLYIKGKMVVVANLLVLLCYLLSMTLIHSPPALSRY